MSKKEQSTFELIEPGKRFKTCICGNPASWANKGTVWKLKPIQYDIRCDGCIPADAIKLSLTFKNSVNKNEN